MKKLNINHLAVLASVVLLFVLGFLWYGPIFGEQWMGMVGLDPAEVEANPPGAGVWITNIISSVAGVYALAWLLSRLGVNSALQCAVHGFIIAFAFVFLSLMTNDMFAQNPYGLSWIVGGFSVVGLTLTGLILGAWQKKTPAA